MFEFCAVNVFSRCRTGADKWIQETKDAKADSKRFKSDLCAVLAKTKSGSKTVIHTSLYSSRLKQTSLFPSIIWENGWSFSGCVSRTVLSCICQFSSSILKCIQHFSLASCYLPRTRGEYERRRRDTFISVTGNLSNEEFRRVFRLSRGDFNKLLLTMLSRLQSDEMQAWR